MESIALLASLCELDPPEAIIPPKAAGNSAAIARLISLGALVHIGKRQSILCSVCDVPHTLAIEHAGNGRYHGFCPDTGFHEVPPETLGVYSVDMQWIARSIASCLGRQPGSASLPAPVSTLVVIGGFRFGPYNCRLFLARRLADRAHFMHTVEAVSRSVGTEPAIIVCTTPRHLIPGIPPVRVEFVDLQVVLNLAEDGVTIDEGPFLAALRGQGARSVTGGIGFTFSPGFRSAVRGDQDFSFTSKQAQAVEALHKAYMLGTGRMHQDEIMGEASTNQRVGQLFRNHPAYGTLIQYDSNGYYWLDL